MPVTDPIADMLNRIMNAVKIGAEKVDTPGSGIAEGIAKTLKEEGFIKEYKIIEDNKQNVVRIYLKYGPEGELVINKIRRISKPSHRVYKKVKDVDKVLDGVGIGIYSTPKGICSDRRCRELKVGGEYICTVW